MSRGSAPMLVAIGCLGAAVQLVLLRELMAAYGGNEFSAGVTVAAWILCEALGAWLAGRPSRPVPALDSLLPILCIVFSLAAVPAAVLVRPLLGVLPGETLSIPDLLLATFLVVSLPAASHGALFVTAAALRTQGIGSAYVWEGIGTAVAGLVCFILLNLLPSISVVAASALPLIAAAGAGPMVTRTKWMMWTLGLATLASLALFVFGLPAEELAWEGAWQGQRVAAISNSPYGKIVSLRREGQQFLLYDGIPVLAEPPTQNERIEELALLPVLGHDAPRRVLVLGHDLAIPAALVRFRPDLDVVAVQLDPFLARYCLAALSSDSSLLSPRFSLIIADPVSFLGASRDAFDCVILTDAAPSSLGSSRLFSAEFYRLCHSRLTPDGILATAGPGSLTGLSPDVVDLLSVRMRTLSSAFEHVLPVAADFPLLLASDRPLNLSAESLVARLAMLSERPGVLDSAYVKTLLDSFRQRGLASALQAETRSPGTTTSSAALPRELFLNMVRENRLVSPAFGAVYAWLGSSFIVERSSPMILLVLAVLLAAGLIGAFARGRPFSRGFAIMTSGFSGAAVSSLLIFAWQVRFGSVFSGVALLVAAFMLGTVLGGILGTSLAPATPVGQDTARRRPPGPRSDSASFLVSDLALTTCAAAPLMLLNGGPAFAFLLGNCLAGACLGFQFAVAGGAASSRRTPIAVRRSAGILTALDLAGGSLGGMLTALFLVPVFGIATATLLAGAVKLVSALAQLMRGRPGSQP